MSIARPAAMLTFHELAFGYRGTPAVQGLSGEVRTGTLLALVGPNGAGKSTLFKGIAGLLKPLAGTLKRGVPPSDIAYLPQVAEIDRSFPISVRDMVAMGLWRRVGPFSGLRRGDRQAVDDALTAVGLAEMARAAIGALSGGQMQRMLFARLTLQDAQLIILDEPFAAVDTRTAADLFAMVQEWHRQGRTVLLSLHDIDLVRARIPETLLLAHGPIAWGRSADVLSADNLRRARLMANVGAEAPIFVTAA